MFEVGDVIRRIVVYPNNLRNDYDSKYVYGFVVGILEKPNHYKVFSPKACNNFVIYINPYNDFRWKKIC